METKIVIAGILAMVLLAGGIYIASPTVRDYVDDLVGRDPTLVLDEGSEKIIDSAADINESAENIIDLAESSGTLADEIKESTENIDDSVDVVKNSVDNMQVYIYEIKEGIDIEENAKKVEEELEAVDLEMDKINQETSEIEQNAEEIVDNSHEIIDEAKKIKTEVEDIVDTVKEASEAAREVQEEPSGNSYKKYFVLRTGGKDSKHIFVASCKTEEGDCDYLKAATVAAGKAATRGWTQITLRLRADPELYDTGYYRGYEFKGSRYSCPAPDNAPQWMPETISCPKVTFVKEIQISPATIGS